MPSSWAGTIFVDQEYQIPEGYGVIIALGGNPVEIVVASDVSLQYLQRTPDPRYLVSARVGEDRVQGPKNGTPWRILHPTPDKPGAPERHVSGPNSGRTDPHINEATLTKVGYASHGELYRLVARLRRQSARWSECLPKVVILGGGVSWVERGARARRARVRRRGLRTPLDRGRQGAQPHGERRGCPAITRLSVLSALLSARRRHDDANSVRGRHRGRATSSTRRASRSARFDQPSFFLRQRASLETLGDVQTIAHTALGVLSGSASAKLSLEETARFATKASGRSSRRDDERRLTEYEKISWWNFVEADAGSPAYQRYFGHGVTRSLVAAKARRASTKDHQGNVFTQIVHDILQPGVQRRSRAQRADQ